MTEENKIDPSKIDDEQLKLFKRLESEINKLTSTQKLEIALFIVKKI